MNATPAFHRAASQQAAERTEHARDEAVAAGAAISTIDAVLADMDVWKQDLIAWVRAQ